MKRTNVFVYKEGIYQNKKCQNCSASKYCMMSNNGSKGS